MDITETIERQLSLFPSPGMNLTSLIATTSEEYAHKNPSNAWYERSPQASHDIAVENTQKATRLFDQIQTKVAGQELCHALASRPLAMVVVALLAIAVALCTRLVLFTGSRLYGRTAAYVEESMEDTKSEEQKQKLRIAECKKSR